MTLQAGALKTYRVTWQERGQAYEKVVAAISSYAARKKAAPHLPQWYCPIKVVKVRWC